MRVIIPAEAAVTSVVPEIASRAAQGGLKEDAQQELAWDPATAVAIRPAVPIVIQLARIWELRACSQWNKSNNPASPGKTARPKASPS